MRLRVLAIALVLFFPPLPAQAQSAGKIARVGVLGLFAPELGARSVAAVREGLDELGWREGQNIQSRSGMHRENVICSVRSRPNWSSKRWTSSWR